MPPRRSVAASSPACAAGDVDGRAAVAAARSAAQASGIAHMGAHALGAAAYAAKAAGLAAPDRPGAIDDEVRWQLARLTAEARAALRRLPPLGDDSAGPLGPGLLAVRRTRLDHPSDSSRVVGTRLMRRGLSRR